MRRALTITAAAAVLAVWPATASAATTWTVQPTPALARSALLGVSCPSAVNCTAVGEDTGVVLAEHWDGSTWTIQPTPAPAGSLNSQLDAVSCATATSCTAVGNYTSSIDATTPLAEHWDGSTWVIQAVPPAPSGHDAELSAVSCTTATMCTAAGSYTTNTDAVLPLAERWDGSTWVPQTVPTPPAARDAQLSGISCPSATRCIAVGDIRTDRLPGKVLAEQWNGTAWAVLPALNPHAIVSLLHAVSCFSASNCTATGESGQGGRNGPFAEHWDGSTWTIQAMPKPLTSDVLRITSMSGVSCAAANRCTAVGWYFDGTTGQESAFAEAASQGTWRLAATARPAVKKNLYAVSCVSASTCTAAGEDQSVPAADVIEPLIEHK